MAFLGLEFGMMILLGRGVAPPCVTNVCMLKRNDKKDIIYDTTKTTKRKKYKNKGMQREKIHF